MLHKLEAVKAMPCGGTFATAFATAFAMAFAMAFASIAFAQSGPNSLLSPNNPNCSPGVEGCAANYPTTDHSDDVPKGYRAAVTPTDHVQDDPKKGTAVYATTDHSDDVPERRASFPPQQ